MAHRDRSVAARLKQPVADHRVCKHVGRIACDRLTEEGFSAIEFLERQLLVEPVRPSEVGENVSGTRALPVGARQSGFENGPNAAQRRAGKIFSFLTLAYENVKVLDPPHGRVYLAIERRSVAQFEVENLLVGIERRFVLGLLVLRACRLQELSDARASLV